jgi:hypothetical protein
MEGRVFSLNRGGELNNKKITKIKYNEGLRWLPFNFFHVTTNQKHVGVTGGGWDRPHDRARTLGERDGNDKGNEEDNDEYGKDGNIPNDDDKYAGGCQTTKKNTRTNQKHAGSTGERQDMRRNRQGAWWERELIILGQLSWDSVKN